MWAKLFRAVVSGKQEKLRESGGLSQGRLVELRSWTIWALIQWSLASGQVE